MKIPESQKIMDNNERDQALGKYQIIRPFIEGEKKLTLICEEHKISLKTVKTWVKLYKTHGINGLLRKARNDKGNRRVCSSEIKLLIEGYYFKNPHLSFTSIYRKILTYTNSRKITCPSYSTICDILNKIPKDMKTLAHEGSKSYKQKFDLLYLRDANAPNEIWQSDHMLLDIFVACEGKESSKKPWLTVIIDDYSRAIAGYELSFMSPSAMKTALCFRQGIWRKQEPHWSIFGIPSIFYTDHGSDFTSKHIEQVCIDLKIQLIFSKIGEPRGRGKIERFFRTLNQMLLSEQTGYTGSKNSTGKLLTLTELDVIIRNFIIEYNQRLHPSINESPKQRWEKNGFLPRIPDSVELLDMLLLTIAKPRKIMRDGIHFQGLKYLDPILAEYVGELVIIRYDPRDLTSIRVFYKDKFLCQPICHKLDQEAVSLKDVENARNERRKYLQNEIKTRLSLVDAILNKKQTRVLPDLKKPDKPSKLKLYDTD